MRRIVLDTNSLIQILPRRARFNIVWQSFLKGETTLCVSNEILEEYLEILQRLTSPEMAEYVIKTITNSHFVEFVTPYYHFHLIQADDDDNKFVDCTIAANAQFIVTNDHHYDILEAIYFPKVFVKTLEKFCDELRYSF